MDPFFKSNKLSGVCYDIRGPVLDHANWLEEQGQSIIKLNIGNPGAFGFAAPDEIIHDVVQNLRQAEGYSHSKGLFSARKAVMQRYQAQGLDSIDVNDIIMGNGVSELIVMAMQGLLNNSDEILIPAPDYPLWTAAVSMSGGKPVHYRCDEADNWQPDSKMLKEKLPLKPRVLSLLIQTTLQVKSNHSRLLKHLYGLLISIILLFLPMKSMIELSMTGRAIFLYQA